MTDHTTHDLAIARAERDAWQSTCEELHRAIAGAIVEIEAHLGRCEAADQRARSLDAALTAEREAGKGLVAQVEQLRGDLQWARSRVKCAGNVEDPCGWRGLGAAVLEWEDSGETPRCPNCDEGCVEIDHVAEAHPECVGNDVAELAAIRDLVAPGNPQGTVVDAVRAMATGLIESIGARDAAEQARDMARDSRDAAIARAEKAEADLRIMSRARDNATKAVRTLSGLYDDSKAELAKLRAEVAELTVTRDRLLAREHEDGRLHAQLRAEFAELRARPVLTVDMAERVISTYCDEFAATDREGRTDVWAEVDQARRDHAIGVMKSTIAKLGAVTLPAQDRAEELARLIAVEPIRTGEWKALVERVRSALASLGAPATTPTAAPGPVAAVSVEELAKLRAELAELRARPVLTEDLLRGALDAHGHAALTRKLFAHLGPFTLPSPDRAEELVSAWRGICTDSATCDLDPAERMRRALASLGAPPTSPPAARPVFAGVSEDELIRLFYVVGTDGIDHGEQCPPIDISDRNGIRAVLARLEVSLVTPVAPTLVAVSDEELATAYSVAHDQPIPRMAPLRDRTIAGIRAVRAKLGAAEVTEERVKAALCEHFKYEGHRDWSADARAILAYLRATAAKGG